MQLINCGIISENIKIAIMVARFNRVINNNLLEGALDILKRMGNVKSENITIIWVPGAYELPITAKALAKRGGYDALIALGAIIRGMTAHFEFVSRECSTRLSEISMQYILPIGFGLLTTENLNQAIERSGIKSNNKGSEAAIAVLEMVNILQTIKKMI